MYIKPRGIYLIEKQKNLIVESLYFTMCELREKLYTFNIDYFRPLDNSDYKTCQLIEVSSEKN